MRPETASPGMPFWLLLLVTFCATLGVHLFVPALATVSHEFGAPVHQLQAAVTMYVLGLATGQLVYGPLSDAFGRRPALLVGLALFLGASLVCMTATSAPVLVAARFFQAFGACAGMILSRAIVKDVYHGDETMRRLAMLALILTATPGVAPLVGGTLTSTLGWRAIFGFMALLAAAGLALTAWLLPETRQASQAVPREVLREYLSLLRTPAFLFAVIGAGCSTASIYAFVAGAPFMFSQRFGTTPLMMGFWMFVMTLGMPLGNLVVVRLSRRLGSVRSATLASGLNLTCAALLYLQTAWLTPTLAGVVATMFVYSFGTGMSSPAALSTALSINPKVPGSASGVYGCGQMAIGALCVAALALGHDQGVMASAVLLAASAVGQLAFRATGRLSRQ